MSPESINELWQVEASGRIFDTHIEEMKLWIAEGSLLRIDRVRKGNLRWIEAGKVPQLIEFFNAKDAAEPAGPVITATSTEILGVAPPSADNFSNPQVPASSFDAGLSPNAETVCSVHPEEPAAYICDTCANSFCRACPNAYGATVRICPFCGAMCTAVAQVEQRRSEFVTRARAASEGFGFGDFAAAIAHPFKFKASLFFGAVMFALVSLGSSASGFGGVFMMAAGIICIMVANMLTFGVLANVADNFSQGKLDENFMPSFDDFSLWDDMVHPFFLSIGAYLSSFGPFLAVMLLAIFLVVGAVREEAGNVLTAPSNSAFTSSNTAASNPMQEAMRIREMAEAKNAEMLREIEEAEGRTFTEKPETEAEARLRGQRMQADEEKYFEDINKMIADQRKQNFESVIGKTKETQAEERAQFMTRILGYGVLFLLLGGVTLLWGLFYFPAACTVAGYTRSFVATINPAVGLDTIRRLGADYFKILLMGIALLIMSGVVGMVLGVVFVAFDMPTVGNLPANFIGGLFTFYFSVVFSCIIGYALYKAADRLELYTH